MAKKTLKKRHIIIPAVILILIIGGYFYVRLSSNKQIFSKLSDRAKEYLASQKKKGDFHLSALSQQDRKANGVDEAVRKKGRINECFNFIIPYPVHNTYSQGYCNNFFGFADPKGSLMAYLEKSGLQSLDDYSGVIFRRQNPDQYEEFKRVVNNKNFLIFRKKNFSEGVDQLSFYAAGGKLFVLDLNVNTSTQEAERILTNILSSVVIY